MAKYKFKTTPYRYQVMAIKKLLSTGFGGALLMAPRTGKTKTLIDYAGALYSAGKIKRVLIFCPLGVIGVWEAQIAQHCPHAYRIVTWDKESRKQGAELPKYSAKDTLDFVIINYDALSTPGAVIKSDEYGNKLRSKRRGGRFDIFKALARWQPNLIALDESHRIKSSSAVKSRMLHKLGKVAEYRVIMTGTVVTKKKRIFDVYSQWKFLNPSRFNMTFTTFKETYGQWTTRNGFPQWLRNINEDDLHAQIHQDAFAISREECYDLPPRREQIIPVKLHESAPYYEQMAKEMVARIQTGEITVASIALVQTLRLRQITSGIAKTEPTEQYPEGRLVRVGYEKLEVMKDLLSDLFEADEKVVVGAQFVGDIAAIARMCEELKVPAYVVRGGVKRRDRDESIRLFRERPGPSCFIAQPQAAAEGIDLSSASICIWFSMTPSYVSFTQFEDRIALSKRSTIFMYLIAHGTVDELLYETLQGDGEVAQAIMASPERLLLRE
jgi:SNF2 family DNA or RNA helicase